MALSPIKSLQHTACRIAGHKTRQEITQELDTRLTSMAQKNRNDQDFYKRFDDEFRKKAEDDPFYEDLFEKIHTQASKGFRKKPLKFLLKHAGNLNYKDIARLLKEHNISEETLEIVSKRYLHRQKKGLTKDRPWASFNMFELFTEALGLGGTLWYSEKFLDSSSKHSPFTYITVETAALFAGFVLGKIPSFVLYAWKTSRLAHKKQGIKAVLQELSSLERSQK